MGSLRWAIVGLAIGVSACATAPRGPDRLPIRQVATIPWSAFSGLTQDDVRRRVGLPENGNVLASSARLDDGNVISDVRIDHVVRNACDNAPDGYRGSLYNSHSNASLHSVNGQISKAGVPKTQFGAPSDETHPFVVSCLFRRTQTFGEQLQDPSTGEALAFLPLVPLVLASKATGDATADKNLQAYGLLRLGEAPPGGLDAFLKAHGSAFTALPREDGDVDLRLNIPRISDQLYRTARIKDGRVVELNAIFACFLREDHSLDCDASSVAWRK